jgi:hypothetical protein
VKQGGVESRYENSPSPSKLKESSVIAADDALPPPSVPVGQSSTKLSERQSDILLMVKLGRPVPQSLVVKRRSSVSPGTRSLTASASVVGGKHRVVDLFSMFCDVEIESSMTPEEERGRANWDVNVPAAGADCHLHLKTLSGCH